MPIEVSESFKQNWGSEPDFDGLMSLDGEVYRQVARRKTFKFSVNDKEYFAKIHHGVGWVEIIKNLVQGRLPVLGASNEYEAINVLTKLGIKTMTLAAYGQRGKNVAELESFVITESLEPSISLEDFCADWAAKKPPLKLKRALIKNVAEITRRLHQNGINHRDLYICHFLLKQNDLAKQLNPAELPLYLIDLHRVQIRLKTPERWLVKDLAALYFSSMDIGLTSRDLYRFIKMYSEEGLREVMQKKTGFWLTIKSKAMQLHNKPVKN
jgi:heptose I phosphotransferase